MTWQKIRAAVAVSGLLTIAACGGGSSSKSTDGASTDTSNVTTSTPSQESSPTAFTVTDVAYRTGTGEGVVLPIMIEMTESPDKTLRVDVSENAVAGVGDMMRAAAWNSVIVASLLTGSLPNQAFRFTLDGYVDGPSAGTLQTIGVLSLLLGDKLLPDITMTGTINPDGTIGPVGGVPEKIQGAAAKGFKRFLIPMGMRNSPSEKNEIVDLVNLGADLGVEVKEVATVYDAYKAFTGKVLPQLPSSSNVQLSNVAYDRLKAKTSEMLAKYNSTVSAYQQLTSTVQKEFNDVANEADALAQKAVTLSDQGLQAGAFTTLERAYAELKAIVFTGQAVEAFIGNGVDGLNTKIDEAKNVDQQVVAFLDTLKTFDPKTVSEAAALINAYGGVFDAYSLSGMALTQVDGIAQDYGDGKISLEDAVTQLTTPLIYLMVAQVHVEGTQALFDVGRDLGGPMISTKIDLDALANLFHRGSDSNWAAFRAVTVSRYSNDWNVSADSVISSFAAADLDVSLSIDQSNTIGSLESYLGEGKPNAKFAELGYAISNYSRNALILSKYESLGVTDEHANLVDVQAPSAFSGALDLAKSQLSANIGLLRDAGVEPALEVGGFEAANVSREGELTDKFDALALYWGSYLSSRALAYLAGIETKGLAR